MYEPNNTLATAASIPIGTINATCSGGTGNYIASQFTTTATVTCSAPTNLTSSAITSNGATVSWTAAGGASSYDVQYKVSSSATWTPTAPVNTTSTSVNISGLNPSTSYDWQVRTNCSSGSSGYSTAQFTTTAVVTCDVYEPNNTLATAASIPIGTINAQIAPSGDVDFYSFSTSGSQKNVKVTLTNLPANYDLTLYNSNGTVLTSSTQSGTTNETVVYNSKKAGTYIVKVNGATANDYSSTLCYTLTVFTGSTTFTVNATIGSNNNTSLSAVGLKIYPVPASTAVTISFDAYVTGSADISILNEIGQQVKFMNVPVISGINSKIIDVSGLRKGIYTVKVNNGKEIQTGKMIIGK